jgi:PadR family transcriptional regulator, regulatory protein PadR
MTSVRANPDFLNGVPELLLLKLLDRQPMHGYELVRAIERATSQTLEFGEGCIYPILHRLEQQGSLSSRREVVGNRTRLVYQVTVAGRTKLVASISSWQRVVTAVNQVLAGESDGHPAVA